MYIHTNLDSIHIISYLGEFLDHFRCWPDAKCRPLELPPGISGAVDQPEMKRTFTQFRQFIECPGASEDAMSMAFLVNLVTRNTTFTPRCGWEMASQVPWNQRSEAQGPGSGLGWILEVYCCQQSVATQSRTFGQRVVCSAARSSSFHEPGFISHRFTYLLFPSKVNDIFQAVWQLQVQKQSNQFTKEKGRCPRWPLAQQEMNGRTSCDICQSWGYMAAKPLSVFKTVCHLCGPASQFGPMTILFTKTWRRRHLIVTKEYVKTKEQRSKAFHTICGSLSCRQLGNGCLLQP